MFYFYYINEWAVCGNRVLFSFSINKKRFLNINCLTLTCQSFKFYGQWHNKAWNYRVQFLSQIFSVMPHLVLWFPNRDHLTWRLKFRKVEYLGILLTKWHYKLSSWTVEYNVHVFFLMFRMNAIIYSFACVSVSICLCNIVVT